MWEAHRRGYKSVVYMGTPNCAEIIGPDHEANARLTAAAPDLLAALELLVVPEFEGLTLAERMEAGRAAIAKAKGQS